MGTRPVDLAFSAGNRELFGLLHQPKQNAPASSSAPAPTTPSTNISAAPTDAARFAEHIRGVQLPVAATAPAGEAPTSANASKTDAGSEQHPRKQFEAFIGNILFPKRAPGMPARRSRGTTLSSRHVAP